MFVDAGVPHAIELRIIVLKIIRSAAILRATVILFRLNFFA